MSEIAQALSFRFALPPLPPFPHKRFRGVFVVPLGNYAARLAVYSAPPKVRTEERDNNSNLCVPLVRRSLSAVVRKSVHTLQLKKQPIRLLMVEKELEYENRLPRVAIMALGLKCLAQLLLPLQSLDFRCQVFNKCNGAGHKSAQEHSCKGRHNVVERHGDFIRNTILYVWLPKLLDSVLGSALYGKKSPHGKWLE